MLKKLTKNLSVFMLCAIMLLSGIGNTSVFAATKLATPKSVAVKLVYARRSKISWKKVSGAKTYRIYYSVNGGSYKKLTTTSKNYYYHYNLQNGKNYRYKIRAYNGSKSSNYSSVKSVKIIGNAKPKVTVKVSGTKMTVKWNYIKNANGYYVYRRTIGGEYKKIADTNNLLYKDTSIVLLGKKYQYKVVPYIKNSGKRYLGSAGTKIATTAKSAYLLDIVKPYEKPYYYKETQMVMAGDTYGHGYTCMGYGDEGFGNVTSFNLKGRYSKISFTAGLLDGDYNKRQADIYIYADGELIKNFTIIPGTLPQYCTADISDCIQLKICVYSNRSVAQWDSDYGIANIKVSK